MDTSSGRVTRRQASKSLMIFGASFLSGAGHSQVLPTSPGQKNKSAANVGTKNAPWLTLPSTPPLPKAAQSGLVMVNGTSIFFAQFGEGPPVLLLHGGPANSNYWGHQIDELARNFSVIVMDTRGHGRSPVTSRAFSYGIFAEDAVALLDVLKISAVSIVGWSDGGVTGLQLAMTKPNRVSKLFVFGANCTPAGYKPAGGQSKVFAEFITRCRTEYAQLSPYPERWPQLLNGLRPIWRTEPNFTKQQLTTLNLPTAISAGEHDEIIRREHTEQIAHEIPAARLVIQPDVSHFAMLQNPPQFNKAMIEFLKAQG
jgi:pimeloyl-ACP methyl ester carboxylesterase